MGSSLPDGDQVFHDALVKVWNRRSVTLQSTNQALSLRPLKKILLLWQLVKPRSLEFIEARLQLGRISKRVTTLEGKQAKLEVKQVIDSARIDTLESNVGQLITARTQATLSTKTNRPARIICSDSDGASPSPKKRPRLASPVKSSSTAAKLSGVLNLVT